ncbi:MAG: DUF3078 domain-containing protein [Bacteroidaceae bacterium]|nr:DUF3078 domain-containing protein [Bacteroidaceae bacterium]
MKRNLLLLLTILTTFAVRLPAESIYDSLKVDSTLTAKYSAKLDSLVMEYAAEVGASVEEISDNPLYFKLFMPLALYNEAISFHPDTSDVRPYDRLLPIYMKKSDEELSLSDNINRTLLRVYLEHPELIEMTENELMSVTGPVTLDESAGVRIVPEVGIVEIHDAQAPDLVINKPSFWKMPGSIMLKYTQTFFSENWYKGGESNHSLLVQLVQEANYAKFNFTWDNKLEAKLGYYTTEKDNETVFKTNQDLLRITSKVGYKAAKSWYYSAQIQAYTQFMDVYDDNSRLKSKFMAPGYGSISVGMDYKPSLKNKNVTLSAQLSPLAYDCRYVSEIELAPKFGIEEGKKFMHSVGSRIEVNWKWTFFKNLKWTGKAQFFTSYHTVQSNLENTLDLVLNKYFSVQLFIHWRYDDSVDPVVYYRHHQFKEFLTLNFTYNW